MTDERNDEYGDEQAARDYTWLTNQAGSQLQELAGGSATNPVFNRLSVEQLEQIRDVAAALAGYHSDAGEVEDPSLTPFDDLPEDAQKAVREQEAADEDADGEPVKTQEQRIREGQSQVESNPHPLEDASGNRPGQTTPKPAAKAQPKQSNEPGIVK